jgi:hypothetical protein
MLAIVGRVDLARIKQREGNIGTLAQLGECRRLFEDVRVTMRCVNRIDDLVSGCEVRNAVARAMNTVPTGFSGVPPLGPAIPVIPNP